MILKNCDMYSFMKQLDDRKIVCFARGFQVNSMLAMYEYPWGEKIKYIVDNDEHLWNESELIGEEVYSIYSPEVLREESADETVVVICSQRCNEILQQLDSMSELDNMECYIFPLMQTYTEMDREGFTATETEQYIPKVIHYCWFGGNPLSENAQKCIDSWKKYCPDYKIVRWDESNYDVTKHPYMREAYENKAYAFVSDYARLDIIYENGGIYMDVDVEVKKNLDPLLYNKAYCGFSSHVPRINTGVGFGAIKGFHILKEMMDAYKYERYVLDYGFNQTLCQIYNTKVLVYHGLIQNGQYQVVDGMSCYPKDYFDSMSSYFYIAPRDEKAFSIHLSANTWSEKNSIKFKKIKDESKKDIHTLLERIDRGGGI